MIYKAILKSVLIYPFLEIRTLFFIYLFLLVASTKFDK